MQNHTGRILGLIKKKLHCTCRVSVCTASTLASRPSRRFKILDGNFVLSNSERQQHEEQIRKHVEEYEEKMTQVLAGGGSSAILRHTHKNKKILARDRIKMLIDNEYPMLELCPFSGLGMDYGDICCAGMVTVIAKISGQLCVVGASDATVKGGTVFPIGVTKQLRMQEISVQNNLPTVYLIDSGGGFLPLQSEVFPGKDHGGRVFYNEAVMNAAGIPQVCVVAGSCTAGAAYIPTMANEVVMVDGIGTIFLAGPPLVYAAIGQKISDQELGGATVHCEVSGCADYKAKDEFDAIELTKDVMSTLNVDLYLEDNRHVEEPFYDSKDLPVLSVIRDEAGKLDIRKILSRLIDGSRFHEFKSSFGKELLTGFARVNGVLIGIVANNGLFTPDSCLKGSNFVSLCNERGIPLVFLQDIIKDDDSSHNTELIKFQAELIASVATSKVPKLTVILGNSFGVGNYAMCGRSMGPNFLFLWPTATISIDNVESMVDSATEYGGVEKIKQQSNCYFSSSRIWDDGVILPAETRKVLSLTLEATLKYKRVEKSSNKNVLRM